MDKTIALLREQLTSITTGTIDDNLIATVRIDYYGQSVMLRDVSSISQKSRIISIIPYDSQTLGTIEQSLKKHGFDAYKFSKQMVVVNVPLPSGEDLEKANKRVRQLGEEARIAIRNIRKKHKKQMDNQELQKITDATMQTIDELLKSKIESD